MSRSLVHEYRVGVVVGYCLFFGLRERRSPNFDTGNSDRNNNNRTVLFGLYGVLDATVYLYDGFLAALEVQDEATDSFDPLA